MLFLKHSPHFIYLHHFQPEIDDGCFHVLDTAWWKEAQCVVLLVKYKDVVKTHSYESARGFRKTLSHTLKVPWPLLVPFIILRGIKTQVEKEKRFSYMFSHLWIPFYISQKWHERHWRAPALGFQSKPSWWLIWKLSLIKQKQLSEMCFSATRMHCMV